MWGLASLSSLVLAEDLLPVEGLRMVLRAAVNLTRRFNINCFEAKKGQLVHIIVVEGRRVLPCNVEVTVSSA